MRLFLRSRAHLKHLVGLDRSIAYTVLARAIQIMGSVGTVLLILRFLSPLEQGYYYTLLSLVALQTVFELGFSFVILQITAHEWVKLSICSNGQISGDAFAHSRLASILQKTTRWYVIAAVGMAAFLLPVGFVFFGHHGDAGKVAWQVPWTLLVIACSAGFSLNPLLAFLEGCGQVQQVAHLRMQQALASTALGWTALVFHHGLYAPALVLVGYTFVTLRFVWERRDFLLPLLRHHVQITDAIDWRTEVWSFQWKIAVTWICSYFTLQIFSPILFAYSGPIAAGQMGMSVGIAGYLSNLVLPWMSTKAAPFGQMIAGGEFNRLDDLFFRTLRQSMGLLIAIVIVVMAAILGLQFSNASLSSRLVSPALFSLLLLAVVSTYIVQSLAIYLRAHRSEPFLWQSIFVALSTLIGAYICIPRWGLAGACVIYFLANSVLGLPWAAYIFIVKRSERLHSLPRNMDLPGSTEPNPAT